MTIKEKLYTSRLWFEGGMGTLLQAKGLAAGELPETWNFSHPDEVRDVHIAYLRAGADIIKTNTFGANPLKMENFCETIQAAVAIAKEARSACADMNQEHYIAFDIGPLGKMLAPFGDLSFENAVSVYGQCMKCASSCGVDLILIETMNDSYETKAAVLAAKEQTNLPVFVTCAYDDSGRLMTGAEPEAMVALLEGLRVDALGINCSQGPRQMQSVVKRLVAAATLPVIVNPNAGLPRCDAAGITVFDVDAPAFAEDMADILRLGATVVGGCCGTTPDYISQARKAAETIPFVSPCSKERTVVSSHARAVVFSDVPVLIGERINPTGKKRFKEALRGADLDYILNEGLSEEEQGAHILDINVGLPEIDEKAMMSKVITELQPLTSLPLQIDTADAATMEAAMRLYNGKPLVNSVNGKKESMDAIFPLVAKYGGVVIGLTLDEDGIPDTAEGRLAIAEKILDKATEYGIQKKDIVIDPLTMAVSADSGSAVETLRAIRLIKDRLGVCTSLGVSNISFGLPAREVLNATFFTMALEAGLDAAIMNPHSAAMMQSYRAFCVLRNMDANYDQYLKAAPTFAQTAAVAVNAVQAIECDAAAQSPLCQAITKGMKEAAYGQAKQLLVSRAPLDVIKGEIIPALDQVGKSFEAKTTYLPQLLLSAEAAKSAFEAVSELMQAAGDQTAGEKIVLATVKGDIHDIGKNIVKVLLSNYGFDVIDLGRDVPPEKICEVTLKEQVRLVGLSALMTTTVPAMEETVRLLHRMSPHTKVMVGGAVLTQDYADMIGADFYGADAMHSVRYAEKIFGRVSDDH